MTTRAPHRRDARRLAIAGNGFFSNSTGPRVTVARVQSGDLDDLFSVIGPVQPNGEHIGVATLHSDIGCDSYKRAIPAGAGDGIHQLMCHIPDEEMRVAQQHAAWWKMVRRGGALETPAIAVL